MRTWSFPAFLALGLLLLGMRPAPEVQRYIFDEEHLFDLVQGSRMDSLLRAHEAVTGNEIVIVSTRSLRGQPDMPTFAASFGDSLGVGKKGRDNGVVIAVSRDLRSVFVATGVGTEKVLNDEQCADIVDHLMIPQFKEGRFAEGLWYGTLAIVQHLEKPENRIPVSVQRRYFQLEQGYLHIDEQAVTFTRSGNWQEAEAATERSRKQGPSRAGRLVIGIVILLTGGLFLLFGHMSDAGDTGSTLVALALSAFGVFSLYRALRHEFSPVYRIPFPKMIHAEGTTEGTLTLRFINGDLQEDQVTVPVPMEAVPLVLEGFVRSRA